MERREWRAAEAIRPSSRSEFSISIAPAERLDDALDVAAALAGVLHEVEVFVWSDLLDADEHGAEPC